MSSLSSIFPNGFAAATASTDLVDPVESFRRHCEASGLTIKELIADGEIHRVPHVSSKKGALDGWYILHTTGKIPVGAGRSQPLRPSGWQTLAGR